MKARQIAFVVVVLAVAGIAICATVDAVRRQQERVEQAASIAMARSARAKLQIGMQRDEARKQSEDAWRSYRCETDIASEEIYVFGSRNLELAGIVYLRFNLHGERMVLTQIATVEYYQLPTFERRCEVREK